MEGIAGLWNQSDVESVIMIDAMSCIDVGLEIEIASSDINTETLTNHSSHTDDYTDPVFGVHIDGHCDSIEDIAKLTSIPPLAVTLVPDNLPLSISCGTVSNDNGNVMIPTTKDLPVTDIRTHEPINSNPLSNCYHDNNSGNIDVPRMHTENVQILQLHNQIPNLVVVTNGNSSVTTTTHVSSNKEPSREQTISSVSSVLASLNLLSSPKTYCPLKHSEGSKNLEASMVSPKLAKPRRRKIVSKLPTAEGSQQTRTIPKKKKYNSKKDSNTVDSLNVKVHLKETTKTKIGNTWESINSRKRIIDENMDFLKTIPVASNFRNQCMSLLSNAGDSEKSFLEQGVITPIAEKLSQAQSPECVSFPSFESDVTSKSDSTTVSCSGSTNDSRHSLLDDTVSESEDESEKSTFRKCVVCLQRKRITVDVCEPIDETSEVICMERPVLKHMVPLFSHLKVSIKCTGLPSELGLCLQCLDQLHKFYTFFQATHKIQTDARMKPLMHSTNSNQSSKGHDSIKYPWFSDVDLIKEVYCGSTHAYLVRRNMTDSDWNFLSATLANRFSRVRSAAEKYFMGKEKLFQIYCVCCKRLVNNGKKGYLKHMTVIHPGEPLLLPCEICGAYLPETSIDNMSKYFSHWIGHFFRNRYEDLSQPFNVEDKVSNASRTKWRHVTPQLKESTDVFTESSESNSSSRTVLGSKQEQENVDANINKNYAGKFSSEELKILLHTNMATEHVENTKLNLCEYCGKSFKTMVGLKRHSGRYHNSTGKFTCDQCGKLYQTQHYLKEHKRIAHPGLPVISMEKDVSE